MLLLETDDDWPGCELTFTFGADTDVYLDADALSGYDLLAGLQAWSTSGARPWAGKTLTWLDSTRDVGDSGFKVTLGGSEAFTLAVNAAGVLLLGLPANSVGVVTVAGVMAVYGSWAPARDGEIAVLRDVRWLQGDGHASGLGAVRAGVPGLAPFAPHVTAGATALDSARLAVILASATSPRRCWIGDGGVQPWTQYAVATVDRTPVDGLLWLVTLGLLREAV